MIPMKTKVAILLLNIIAVYRYNAVFGELETIAIQDTSAEEDLSVTDSLTPPENNNNSIQYHLYTPENPKKVCYFEPNVSNSCKFNMSFEFKILIHGYTVRLLPGNFLEQIKDTLLEYNKYNVIIVNWTQYDGSKYTKAVEVAYEVAINIGETINFLVGEGVNVSNVHIIGHSLGAHIAGVAGKQVKNLSRITGLDPAGPLFSKEVRFNRLTNDSAILVDVIHTSNYTTGAGFGLPDAIGSIDFYPNGGNKQPACQMEGQYRDADGTLKTITTLVDLSSCYHDMALSYFMSSIHVCGYPSVECGSYELFSAEGCNASSNPTNRMGLFCELIPGLPDDSTFYLNTSADFPFCEKE